MELVWLPLILQWHVEPLWFSPCHKSSQFSLQQKEKRRSSNKDRGAESLYKAYFHGGVSETSTVGETQNLNECAGGSYKEV